MRFLDIRFRDLVVAVALAAVYVYTYYQSR